MSLCELGNESTGYEGIGIVCMIPALQLASRGSYSRDQQDRCQHDPGPQTPFLPRLAESVIACSLPAQVVSRGMHMIAKRGSQVNEGLLESCVYGAQVGKVHGIEAQKLAKIHEALPKCLQRQKTQDQVPHHH